MFRKEKYSYITQLDYETVAGPDWPSFSVFASHDRVPDFVYNEIDLMLTAPEQFDHPSFCVLPFYGLEYPRKTFCCLVPPRTDRELVKQQMIEGQRPDACNKCWVLEESGIKSDRLIKNETLDFYTNKNIKDLFNECVEKKSKIVNYKIDTNNVCNSTCVTCSSMASSAWAKLEKEHGKKAARTWQINDEEIDTVVDYSTAESITFRGGEPFMSKTNFYILEKLVQYQNTDCFISFVTNGSFDLTDKQIQLIKKFPNVNFCFSIDGIGPVFDYLRYPLTFEKIKQNIDFCKNNEIIVSVSYTLSNINILYHNQTVSWFEENNLKFIVNSVYNPAHFRPAALPLWVKEKIKNSLEPNIQKLISTHSSNDDQDYKIFCQIITKQDAWKNIQLKNYLPDLADLLAQK